jgi:hypothetical protein
MTIAFIKYRDLNKTKVFKYGEILDLCVLCATHGARIATEINFDSSDEGLENTIQKVQEIIDKIWE